MQNKSLYVMKKPYQIAICSLLTLSLLPFNTLQVAARSDQSGKEAIEEQSNVQTRTRQDDIYEYFYTPLGHIEKITLNNWNYLLNTYATSDQIEYLKQIDYANGDTIVFEHDDNGRITSRWYDDDDMPRFEYSYDQTGAKKQTIDNDNRMYTYHWENSEKTYYMNPMRQIYHFYEKKADGILETAMDTNYERIDQDKDNELFKVNLASTANLYTIADNYYKPSIQVVYDMNPSKTSIMKKDYGYDVHNQLTHKQIVLGNRTLTWKNKYENYLLTNEEFDDFYSDYYYDTKSQLVRYDHHRDNDFENSLTTIYKYDSRGNMVERKTYYYAHYMRMGDAAIPIEEDAYEYNNSLWEDQLSAVNGQGITYDGIGNPINYKGWSLAWQAGTQLKSMSNGYADIQYIYNDAGERLQKIVNGNVTKFTYVDGRITSQQSNGDKLYFQYDKGGNLFGLHYNGEQYYYLTNAHGDVIGIADHTGNQVVAYTYDPWGDLIAQEGDGVLANLNPIRYAGAYKDSETGYYLINKRYYDPKLKRYLQPDDIKTTLFTRLYNLYSFEQNNPLN